ncbi:MAG: TRAP transporter fused permease subunit [Marinosulfonomonas sp.]|nr:TRAP transporter fused permease subunit [Marinosulfonomonas sp.]
MLPVFKTVLVKMLSSGGSVALNRQNRIIATILSVPLAAFEIWLAFIGIVTPLQLGLFFMAPLLIIAFLTTTGRLEHSRTQPFDFLMAIVVAVAGGYLIWHSERLSDWILGISSFSLPDRLAGLVMIFATLVILKRTVGPGMLTVVLILMGYLAFGHLIDGFLYHREFSWTEIIEQSIISNNGGLFGTPVAAAASYVYLFVVFGKILQTSGGGQFFFDFAAAIAGRRRGGVAKVSIVSSGLFGMISGSPTSDVVTTGTITIPMMKRMGYPAHIASAIETVASVGGSFLPPVMGAVVFILVEFTGIPYGEVIRSSVIVALLYYFAIYFQVHHYSTRHNIGQIDAKDIPQMWSVLKKGWIYIVPIFLLMVMIEQGYTAQYSVSVTILATIVFSWLHSNRDYRVGPMTLIKTVTDAAVVMAPLVAAVAGAGLVEQVLNVTGIGSKISYQMFEVADGQPILILIFAALVTIVFGMGMPVPAVYALAAILLAPGMIQAGFDLLSSHLFLVWFSVASHLTPPIAVAAYVAAAIGEAKPMRTSVWASRLGMVAFMLPFIFMLRGGVLAQGTVVQIVTDTVFTASAITLFATASMGWFRGLVPGWMRLALLVLGALAAFAVTLPALAAGASLLGFALIWWSQRAAADEPVADTVAQSQSQESLDL